MDAIARKGGKAGSVQIAELVAEFQIEHDEYEARQRKSEQNAQTHARAQRPPQSLGSARRAPR